VLLAALRIPIAPLRGLLSQRSLSRVTFQQGIQRLSEADQDGPLINPVQSALSILS
jgi:hypothetical protein